MVRVFVQTEYGDLIRRFSYSVQMQENNAQKTPNTNTFYALQIRWKKVSSPLCLTRFIFIQCSIFITYLKHKNI